MKSEALKKAQKRYFEKLRWFKFAINTEEESDLAAHLESQKNKTAYLKELIRKDMKKINKKLKK